VVEPAGAVEIGDLRFVVAHASGRRCEETLAAEAIQKAHARSRGQPVSWCSDGWRAYPKAITRAYRRPLRTGRRGRPPLRVPEGLSLTQTIKHWDGHGRLVNVEPRATIGAAAVEQPVPVHSERLNGMLRDRLACLTRKTHAFAKTTSTWDALFGLALFEHNWLRPHPALGQLSIVPRRYYERRTPAMAIGLTDHRWFWPEFLTTKAIVSS
jgi:IS1 family transposase